MLKRPKKHEKEKTPESSAITNEEKHLLVSDAVPKAEQTVIGEKITIEGSIRGEEHLVIDGAMKGAIELKKNNFSIGAKGRFEGEIQALNVSISGEMNGDINTQGKVQISKEADFIGKIKAKTISVEDGAYFKGVIELQRDPHRKATVKPKADVKSSPQPDNEPLSKPEGADKKGN
jgi:cytoskeletal protein CcmA (bactofilin family)